MPAVEIDDLTKIGVIQDEPIFQQPPEALSLGTNMRSYSNGIEKVKGWSQTMGTVEVGTKLLLHFDGANGATSTSDSSFLNHTMTMANNPTISTAQSKFGGASVSLNGVNQSVTTPMAAEFQPSGDFTIEMWVYLTGSPASAQAAFGVSAGGVHRYLIWNNSGSTWVFNSSSNGVSADIANNVSMGNVVQNAWTHLAVVRSGNNYATYNNGVQISTFTNSSTPMAETSPLQIGGGAGVVFQGFIDEVRFSNVARYTGSFTPQTIAFPNDPPSMALYISSTAQPWWLWPSLSKIYVWDGTNNTDITRTLAPYTATDADQWNGCILGGVPILNNGGDSPQFWNSYSVGTKMQDLTNWPGAGSAPATTKCLVMRSFLSYLIALNMTTSGTNFPHRVRWSSSASPGNLPSTWDFTDPTNDAGQNDLPDVDSGLILDGGVLGNQFFIYKESAVWRMAFIGAPYIFSFQVFLPTTGILCSRAVATTGPLPNSQVMHVLATQDDIVAHNGFMVESILNKRMKRYLAANLDPTNFATSFMMPNPPYEEMWFCYPTNGNAHPNRAIIWNWRYNTLTEADGIDFQGFGIGTIFNSAGPIWNNANISWNSDTSPWSAAIRRRVVICNPNTSKIHLFDQGTVRDGLSFMGTLQRTNLAIVGRKRSGEWIEDFQRRKLVSALWPKVQNGPINVRVGYNDLPNQNSNWSPYLPFDPSTQVFVNGMLDGPNQGSARAFGIEFSSVNDFRVDGYKADISLTGEY